MPSEFLGKQHEPCTEELNSPLSPVYARSHYRNKGREDAIWCKGDCPHLEGVWSDRCPSAKTASRFSEGGDRNPGRSRLGLPVRKDEPAESFDRGLGLSNEVGVVCLPNCFPFGRRIASDG